MGGRPNCATWGQAAPGAADRPRIADRQRGPLRIAELAADGLTNREIAQTLFVTSRTVEGHLTNVFNKLGVKDRTGSRRPPRATRKQSAPDTPPTRAPLKSQGASRGGRTVRRRARRKIAEYPPTERHDRNHEELRAGNPFESVGQPGEPRPPSRSAAAGFDPPSDVLAVETLDEQAARSYAQLDKQARPTWPSTVPPGTRSTTATWCCSSRYWATIWPSCCRSCTTRPLGTPSKSGVGTTASHPPGRPVDAAPGCEDVAGRAGVSVPMMST